MTHPNSGCGEKSHAEPRRSGAGGILRDRRRDAEGRGAGGVHTGPRPVAGASGREPRGGIPGLRDRDVVDERRGRALGAAGRSRSWIIDGVLVMVVAVAVAVSGTNFERSDRTVRYFFSFSFCGVAFVVFFISELVCFLPVCA